MRAKLTRRALLASMVILSPMIASSASAQEKWPDRTVRLILPFGPGSGAALAARLLAEKLQTVWGQSVVVEGRPGGGGLLSIRTVVGAKDDHVLFFGPTSAFVVHPYLHENLPYDPHKDLNPIAGVANVQIAMAVPTSLGINTLKEFVDHARKHGDKVSYGVAPGFSEFVLDGFIREQGLKIARVPYRDITTAVPDLGEGRLQLAMMSFAAMRAAADGGAIKFIGMNSAERSEVSPDTPSVVEAGYPTLVASPILGLFGPRDMPLTLRQKIASDILEVMKDDELRQRLVASGQPPAPMNVEDLAAGVDEQHAIVARIAKVLGMERKK